MNEQDDGLEEELRSLRPTPPSPRVRQQISDRLRPRMWRSIAAAGIAIAALIMLAATLWLTSPIETPAQQPPQIAESHAQRRATPTITSSGAGGGGEVSAWRYHQMARQSPEQLMRLLDEQAANAPAIGGPTPSVHQLLESNS